MTKPGQPKEAVTPQPKSLLRELGYGKGMRSRKPIPYETDPAGESHRAKLGYSVSGVTSLMAIHAKDLARVIANSEVGDREARQAGVRQFVADLPGAYSPGATWLDSPGYEPEERAIGWFLGKYTDAELVACFARPSVEE